MSKPKKKPVKRRRSHVPAPFAAQSANGKVLWGETRDEPDFEKIAQVIIDLATYLADSGKTLEQYQAENRKHRQIQESLRKRRVSVGPKDALTGCPCRVCERRNDQAHLSDAN